MAVSGAFLGNGWYQSRQLVDKLESFDMEQMPTIAADLAHYRYWAEPRLWMLVEAESPTAEARAKQLRPRLVLVQFDAGQVEPLTQSLLAAPDPTTLRVIRQMLGRHRETLARNLWSVLHDPEADRDTRFRAGLCWPGMPRMRTCGRPKTTASWRTTWW